MTAMSINAANQFIGSRISLVSKADIRYEGTLYCLDLRDATISLAKVRSYGTEDRPTERPIPMKDDIYEFIIFRGADIKSIDVLEPPRQGSTMPCGLPQDPAIIEVSHWRGGNNGGGGGGGHNCGSMDHSMRYSSNNREGVFEGLLRGNAGGRSQGNRHGGSDAGMQDRNRGNNGRNYNNRNMDGYDRSRQDNYRGGNNSGANQGRNGRGNTPNRNQNNVQNRDRSSTDRGQNQNRQRGIIEPQQPPKVTFEDPFDFEKSNEELKTAMEKLKISGDEEKKEGEVKAEEDEKKEDPMIYYDKDKFFDNISCEALERNRGKVTRVDWQAERKMNAETFGLTWNPNQRNNSGGRNNYRPRGGGFRGGYINRGDNNQMRYNNYNNRFNSRNYYNNGSNYGNRGQQQRT